MLVLRGSRVSRVVILRSHSSPASSYPEKAHVEKKPKQFMEEGSLSSDDGDAGQRARQDMIRIILT